MSTTSEKANLARIRDNQRRSRARRKEYLQELEARLRQCELQGIEASAEIQLAARRVADENRQLRDLLAQHGIGVDSIEAYVQSSPTADTLGQHGSTSSSVLFLEQLLQVRKPYASDGNTGALTNLEMGGAGSQNSSNSQTTVQALWEPIHPQSLSIQTTGKPAAPTHQFMTPSSSGSRVGSNGSLSHASNHSISQLQRITPVSSRRYPSPASNHIRHNPQMYEYDSQLSLSNTFTNHSATAQQHLQPHRRPLRSSTYTASPTSPNLNSCEFAADMITTMAGGDPSSVRADLGCLPGMDCEVDNDLVFDVMDRYTSHE